ncbi:hypothetical protein M2359_002781 [Gordonia amarae]|nr:hypothetical protein [Gordonia amarae]
MHLGHENLSYENLSNDRVQTCTTLPVTTDEPTT